MGVCNDRASLLSDRFVDHSGTLDVACLSFAYSEDVGDALDAMYIARGVVLGCLSACEGFLYGFVDYLCELCYGEVDDSGVLMYHVLFVLSGPRGRSRTSQAVGRNVSAFVRRGLTPAASRGWEGLSPLCFVIMV